MTVGNQTRDWTPAKWVRVLLPLVLIVAWVVAAGFGGPTFGKLSDVSTNDQSSFLPASAESTKVDDWRQKFADADTVPAVVILTSDSTIEKRDLARFAALGKQLGDVDGVAKPGHGTDPVAGPIPSKDGHAVEFIVQLADNGDVHTTVGKLRTILSDQTPSSITAHVTGPAGMLADLVDGFAGIDGILLVVAIAAVFIILLLVYRAVILPILVLLTAVFALTAAILLVYAFAAWGWITLTGMSQGILSILVIGAATDYSLLLVARYRESLQQVENKWAALGRAWRGAWAPIVASGATVIISLLCLLFSDLNSNKGLGPIAAIGIAFAILAALSLLPMLLAVFGRVAFWPFRPEYRPDGVDDHTHRAVVAGLGDASGLWRSIGLAVSRRPRVLWVASAVLLAVCTVGIFQLKADGVSQSDLVLTQTDSKAGQQAAAKHFPSGLGSPVIVIADEESADATLDTVKKTRGIDSASIYTGQGSGRPGSTEKAAPKVEDGKVMIDAVLAPEPDSAKAEDVVSALRSELPSSALVGGQTATSLDTTTTAEHDRITIIPIVLAVIFVILMLLLRSIVAPLVLIASVVASFISALGVSAVVFNHVFGFPGADASVPLYGFVFLVALGVDYNIFLMTRVHEESRTLGTRPGILAGLSKTGSVITSAGIVLAATFAALGVIPILFLAQIAFIVAFGVLLDTIVVRSVLVPALSYDIGPNIWWPSRLRRFAPDR